MSAVTSHRQKSNKRHVHFLALNWEEEEQRTNRGVALRREQRQRQREQKRVEAEREKDRKKAYLVLRDSNNESKIFQLCRDHVVLDTVVHGFLVVTLEQQPGSTSTQELMDGFRSLRKNLGCACQELLQRFRVHEEHLGLTDEEHYDRIKNEPSKYIDHMDFLACISFYPKFRNAFLLEGTNVSDTTTTTSSSSSSSSSRDNSNNHGVTEPMEHPITNNHTQNDSNTTVDNGSQQHEGNGEETASC